MKKVVLSALAATIVTSAVYAETMTLFSDPKTGQVFTTAGEGRIEMGDFVSAKEVDIANRETTSFIAEYQDADKKSISVINSKSPKFILGQETGPNMKIKSKDNKDMYMKFGVRLQSTFENRLKDYANPATATAETNDAYMRRVRLEVEAGFDKHTSFVMDMRNDNANAEDKGEQTFNVGDAYLNISKPFDTSLVNFKLYRGKIDVSRSETAKSAHNLHYDRPHVADEAAQFITHNRRGTNAQMYGDWEKKVHYQVAVGDGVYSGAMKDADGSVLNATAVTGTTLGTVKSQNFFYGGKIKLSPFDGWEEEKLTETYMGQGQHFTVGAAYWKTGNIKTNSTTLGAIDHELINLEASAHYKGASISAEYFEFDGVVKNFTTTMTQASVGKSTGWYTHGEYVFTDFGFVAPFYRYESWDKFKGADGYDLTSKIAGVNWYLRGNTTKVGFAVQKDTYGSALSDYTDTRFKLTSQFHF
ncbi:MAG: porin [Sulfuricurvum sp.]|nr:porin [Sulfuricurvum sp.]